MAGESTQGQFQAGQSLLGTGHSEVERAALDAIDQVPEGLAPQWIQQLLGDWVVDLFGSGGNGTGSVSVLMDVLGYANIVALVVGVVIFGYVLLAGLMKTASEGQVLGRNWSTFWLPLRTFLMLFLLSPAPFLATHNNETYVSSVQAGVAKLALVGSNLGDLGWNAAVDGLMGRPPIYSMGIDAMTPTLDVLGMEICAIALNYDDPDGKPDLATVAFSDGVTERLSGDGSIQRAKDELGRIAGMSGATSIAFGTDGDCGTLSLQKPTNRSQVAGEFGHDLTGLGGQGESWTPGESPELAALRQRVRARADKAMLELAGSLSEVAGDIVKEGGESLREKWDEDRSEQVMELAVRTYDQAAKLFSDLHALGDVLREDDALVERLRDSMKRYGWAYAGVWYLQLPQVSAIATDAAAQATSGVAPESPPMSCSAATYVVSRIPLLSSVCRADGDIENGRPTVSDALTAMFLREPLKAHRVTDMPSSGSGCTVGSCGPVQAMDGVADAIGTNVSMFVSGGALDMLAGMGPGTMGGQIDMENDRISSVYEASGIANPFLTLAGIGHAINAANAGAWAAIKGLAVLKGLSVAGSEMAIVGSAVGFLGRPMAELAAVSIMSLLSVLAILLPVGFLLSYVIPFTPVLIWIMLVVGWLVMVIEAMVASPLAVVQMATPEGEGISGTRMERAMSIIIALTARPFLVVVGLVASLGVAFIGFAIFNLLFWSAFALNTSAGLFEIIAGLVLYTTGAIKVTQTSIEVMHTLPNHILEWFSSGASRAFGEQGASHGLQGSLQTGITGVTNTKAAVDKAIDDKRASDARLQEKGKDGSGGESGGPAR